MTSPAGGSESRALVHLASRIQQRASRSWTVMDICGGQTHTIVGSGLVPLLEPAIRFVHGPGCPVCVTDVDLIDHAHEIASERDVTLACLGDVMRMRGSSGNFYDARAKGHSVKVVGSPLDALALASVEPPRRVVYFAIGFETTAPATALAIRLARRRNIHNFSVLSAHVLVAPAIDHLLARELCQVDGLLGPGHACSVTGLSALDKVGRDHRKPIVIAGFSPSDLCIAIMTLTEAMETWETGASNAYDRVVKSEGNPAARALIEEVFEPATRTWFGIGPIARSGLNIRDSYAAHDASKGPWTRTRRSDKVPSETHCGEVLSGARLPRQCPWFGTTCTPQTPLGAPMTSAEGACAAYFTARTPTPEGKTHAP